MCAALTDDRPRTPRPVVHGRRRDTYRCASHAPKQAKPECAVCAALPDDDRPSPPRPIVYGTTIPSRRCHTHREADKLAVRARAQAYKLGVRHDITEEEYQELYEAQGRKCWFPRCRATGKVKRLAVDHDRDMAVNVCGHEREKSCRQCRRGLLCGPHNQDLMGRFAGDLEDAIAYRDNPPWWRLRRTA